MSDRSGVRISRSVSSFESAQRRRNVIRSTAAVAVVAIAGIAAHIANEADPLHTFSDGSTEILDDQGQRLAQTCLAELKASPDFQSEVLTSPNLIFPAANECAKIRAFAWWADNPNNPGTLAQQMYELALAEQQP